jgi:hypothetical protein
VADSIVRARDITKGIWRKSGFRGFYVGASSPIIWRAPLTAWFFTSHELVKPRLAGYNISPDLINFVWGAWAGTTLLPVLVPVELFKCKAQAVKGEPYQISTDFKAIIKRQGISGLYRGTAATYLREVPGSGVLFMVKDKLEKKMRVQQETRYPLFIGKKILAGGWAGLSAWCASIPIDTIKSIIQTSSEKKRIHQVALEIYTQGGIKPFFRGMVPQAWRIFPLSGSLLLTYELLKNYLE